MEVRLRWAGPALAGALLAAASAVAAPFVPASDQEVVETLPAAGDPALRSVESLRRQLAARADDAALRLDIAQRYFGLAMAQGDPRYVGYAQAAIGPLARTAADNPRYWLVRGLTQQYSHDFDGALASLRKASALDPQSAEPVAWRAAIRMVQARYTDALAECEALAPIAHPLFAQGCEAYVQASTGQLQAAYDGLWRGFQAQPQVAPELALWLHTRLAEMAQRLGRDAEAEQHFRAAIRTGVTDQFLLGAYADFLIERGRADQALGLLQGWERSDILLLRLALAARAARDPRADDWSRQLRARFDDAARRGDRLHEQEAARFALDLENRPDQALALARSNYDRQKEPRDAEILMRAALAARQPKAAQSALDWLRDSSFEDPRLQKLATALGAGAAR